MVRTGEAQEQTTGCRREKVFRRGDIHVGHLLRPSHYLHAPISLPIFPFQQNTFSPTMSTKCHRRRFSPTFSIDFSQIYSTEIGEIMIRLENLASTLKHLRNCLMCPRSWSSNHTAWEIKARSSCHVKYFHSGHKVVNSLRPKLQGLATQQGRKYVFVTIIDFCKF